TEKLPVLVYFYGGGLVAGDGSEPRYEGESMARRGIVAITINYRLSVFGFFSHPELTKESPNKASGNYGFMDQLAALKWVQKNIAAFGGDPKKVTIAGESAGSFSVSAQMASPLAKGLFAGAIGESGSLLGNRAPVSLQEAEKFGEDFAKGINASSLAKLREMSADDLIKATSKPGMRFPVSVDGYFFSKSPNEVFTSGAQAQVPLLVGWNSEEGSYKSILGGKEPTAENYKAGVEKMLGDKAAEALKLYPATNEEEIKREGTALASDQFIAFGTWRWSDMHLRTGNKPVYRYYYAHPRPAMRAEMGNTVANLAGGTSKGDPNAPKAPIPTGAVHSAEIEYALGNLPTNRVYDWQAEDYKVSEIMQAMFENFIKTGNPNGLGLPQWPAAKKGQAASVMHIDANAHAETEKHRERYLSLEKQIK
ncbi:MAG: carboxylesterase family protein, partial [Mucilaginibacter polytrichastri]|nr:carboxylesterase family protein [Mucilaginibacter polytrichastri]